MFYTMHFSMYRLICFYNISSKYMAYCLMT